MSRIEIFKLFGSILVDSAQAEKSISKTGEEAEGLGTKLGNGIKTAGKWAAGITAGATAVGAAVLGMASQSAEATDKIDKMSQKIGLSKQAYQEWNYAMGQSGIDIGVMQNGVKTLTNLMDSAKNGTESAAGVFDQLGISIYDSNGAMKSQEDMMRETIMTLADMEDSTERAKLSTQLFGRAGTELEPLLNSGADGINALIDRSHELGLVMSDEAVNAGVVFGDTMSDVKDSLSMLGTKLGVAVMPAIQTILDLIIDNLPMIQSMFDQFLPPLIGFIEALLPHLMSIVQSILPILLDLIDQLLPFISELLEAILPVLVQLLDTLLPPLMQIVQAVLPIIITLLEPLLPLLQPILSLLSPLIDLLMALLMPLLELINLILPTVISLSTDISQKVVGFVVDALTELVSKITGFVTNMTEAGKKLFTGLWDGIKGVWDSISSWISEKVSWVVDKLSFWKKSSNEMDSGRVDGSHAAGLPFVPYDGYTAELHRGEAVLNADTVNRLMGMLENTVSSKSNNESITINASFNLDGEEIGRKTYKYSLREARLRGNSLVAQGG